MSNSLIDLFIKNGKKKKNIYIYIYIFIYIIYVYICIFMMFVLGHRDNNENIYGLYSVSFIQ